MTLGEEKQLWRRQELEEERKSVRFNLEQELDIRFNLTDTSDQEEGGDEEEEEGEDWNSDEEDPDEERVIAGIRVSGEILLSNTFLVIAWVFF